MSLLLAPTAAIHIESSARILVEAWSLAYGISFTSDALLAIHVIIHKGVQKMVDHGHVNKHQHIFKAQTNLAAFLLQLTNDAKTGRYAEVEQHHVEETQNSFCPVYPFS